MIPDGTLNLFVDMQHGMIYGKAVAPNGAAELREFAYRQPVQQPAEPQTQWASRDALERLQDEVKQLKEALGVRGGNTSD